MNPRLSILLCLVWGIAATARSQPAYFPPVSGATWAVKNPQELGWRQDKIDTLLQYLEEKDTRGFVVLHQGKIVIEQYFHGHSAASFWYWASAGKTLTAFLVGMAQAQGLLRIHDSVGAYLGPGWTSATLAQEGRIQLIHQLTMTTGLDDRVADKNCRLDTCLRYFQPPGSRWAYYNAPYLLLHDVLEAASGQALNSFTQAQIGSRIGMGGFWLDGVRYGRTRDLARFGLLMLADGIWNQDTLLPDTAYLHAMTRASQPMNPAYGYLWWLNSGPFFLQPGLQIPFPGSFAPSAPADMYSALGRDDQKIYVVPSLDLVVVRVGEKAYDQLLAVSPFDDELWALIMDLYPPASTQPSSNPMLRIVPNPASGTFRITGLTDRPARIQVYDMHGRLIAEAANLPEPQFSPYGWTPSLYQVCIQEEGRPVVSLRLVVAP